MKKTVYRCLVVDCGAEFDGLSEIEFHLEHATDDSHKIMVERLGVNNCYQEWTTEEDQELDELREEKPYFEYPKHSKEAYPKAHEYPYAPYYKEGEAFICTEHRFGTKDIKEFFRHMLELHKNDFEDFLRHHVKQSLIHRIRVEKGSSEYLSDDTMDRLVDSEIKELMITAELKHGKNAEALRGFVDTRFSNLKAFLTAERQICPLCNRDVNAIVDERYLALSTRIVDSLKKGMNLSGKEKSYQDYVKRKYKGKWQAEDIDLCLCSNLHMVLEHKGNYRMLVAEQILSGDLPTYLLSFDVEKEKLNLSTLMGKNLEVPSKNLTKGDKAFLEYLKKGK